MKQQHKLILAGIVVVIMSMLDYQYFSEYPYCYIFSETQRRSFHIFCLAVMAGTGYWCWASYQLQWVKKTWLVFYSTVMAVMLLTGALQVVFHLFSQSFLNAISAIRLFFCTPVPFFVMVTLLKTLRANTVLAKQ